MYESVCLCVCVFGCVYDCVYVAVGVCIVVYVCVCGYVGVYGCVCVCIAECSCMPVEDREVCSLCHGLSFSTLFPWDMVSLWTCNPSGREQTPRILPSPVFTAFSVTPILVQYVIYPLNHHPKTKLLILLYWYCVTSEYVRHSIQRQDRRLKTYSGLFGICNEQVTVTAFMI